MSKMRLATGFMLAVLGLVAAVAVGSTPIPESNTPTPAANTVEDAIGKLVLRDQSQMKCVEVGASDATP